MASRLCVKGLPKYLEERQLKQHFEARGDEVTDVKILRTKTGKSRQFGFVGFRTEKDAQKCLKYFHDTFIDTSKIICEIARPKGDEKEVAQVPHCFLGAVGSPTVSTKNQLVFFKLNNGARGRIVAFLYAEGTEPPSYPLAVVVEVVADGAHKH